MGCDGGTIPTRDELVKTKKKPEQKDKDSVRLYKWQHCHLSQQRLTKPIVACELGFMYNKEVIIEKLLDSKANKDTSQTTNNAVASHIKSLKDVRELELTDNPAFKRRAGVNGGAPEKKEKATVGDGGYNDRLSSPYVCPIAGLEMNGKFKFVFDWKKGRALSERGHKIVMKNDPDMRIPDDDLIVINPDSKEEAELMLEKMQARRAKAKAAKAAKKAAGKRKASDEEELGSSSSSKAAALMPPPPPSTSTATTTKAPQQQPSKATNGKESSSSDGKTKAAKANGSKAKAASVQNDPTKSEVYKSLFSSHKSAVNKPKGHWVTFDPRYN